MQPGWRNSVGKNRGIRLVLVSGTGCRFYTQSFVYARSFVYAQSFAFAVFATLICQINSVFPCKDTKAAKSVAFCDSLSVFLRHRASFWHRALFWQPLQPWFVKETAFFFAKAQNSGIRVVPDSGTGCRFYTQSFAFASGNSCFNNSRVQKLQKA